MSRFSPPGRVVESSPMEKMGIGIVYPVEIDPVVGNLPVDPPA
jgi:hypothetical protein